MKFERETKALSTQELAAKPHATPSTHGLLQSRTVWLCCMRQSCMRLCRMAVHTGACCHVGSHATLPHAAYGFVASACVDSRAALLHTVCNFVTCSFLASTCVDGVLQSRMWLCHTVRLCRKCICGQALTVILINCNHLDVGRGGRYGEYGGCSGLWPPQED